MVVRVELRRGELHTNTKAEMESLYKWKGAEHKSRRHEHFLLAARRAARSVGC